MRSAQLNLKPLTIHEIPVMFCNQLRRLKNLDFLNIDGELPHVGAFSSSGGVIKQLRPSKGKCFATGSVFNKAKIKGYR